MADQTDFAARLARIETRARSGSKVEFAPLPDEIMRRENNRNGKSGPKGPRRARRGLSLLLSLAVMGGGLAFFYEDVKAMNPDADILAVFTDNTDGFTNYMIDTAKSYMSSEDVDRMENDPGVNAELKRLGLEDNGMARLILSN